MSACVIGHITVKDEEKWAQYRAQVPATLAPWGAELLFRGHPRQLRQLCAYSRELAYEAKPNYDQMRAWMRELLIEREADPDVLEPWSDAKLQRRRATEKR